MNDFSASAPSGEDAIGPEWDPQQRIGALLTDHTVQPGRSFAPAQH